MIFELQPNHVRAFGTPEEVQALYEELVYDLGEKRGRVQRLCLYNPILGTFPLGLWPEAEAVLRSQPWPGNVRELRAVISRAALLHDDKLLRPQHLPAALAGSAPERKGASPSVSGLRSLAEVEIDHIQRVLAACGGNRTLAAQHLGITRQTLSRRLDEGEE